MEIQKHGKTRLTQLVKPLKLMKEEYYIFLRGQWREANKECYKVTPPSRFALAP
jgi:hypothetical protein